MELFLVENKSVVTLVLQNMSKGQRIPQMQSLFDFLVKQSQKGMPTLQAAIDHLGLKGRILEVTEKRATASHFNEDAKSMMFVQSALQNAIKCPVCGGYLHPVKSVSYDHVLRVSEGGTGSSANGQMVHPFCNTGVKA